MAYRRKYYKELVSQGHTWRLDIYQNTGDESLKAVEIGPVLQGLRLIMQGDQADIDTPIVKTSLEMIFVDAPDLETDRKCGYWEEFYTSSATEYKVYLSKDGVREWSGYITPDSFSESLQYRGSVTIIARDNLGSLQDFEFDAPQDSTGLISLADIIQLGLQKISFPMAYTWGIDGVRKLPYSVEAQSGYEKVSQTLFNNRSFVNKTWLEAVEEVLFATGLAIRYIGHNTVIITSLRDIPLYDKNYWWDVPILDVSFCAYGQRELAPAVKFIREEVQFETSEQIVDPYTPAQAYGSATTYKYGDLTTGTQKPVHVIDKGIFKDATLEKTIFLDAYKYDVYQEYRYGKGGEIHNPDIVYVCANLAGGSEERDNRKVGFSVHVPAGSYKVTFEVNKVVALYNNETAIGYADYPIEYWRFNYEGQFIGSDGTIKTLSNRSGTLVVEPEWKDGNIVAGHLISGVELPYSVESPVLTIQTDGTIKITLTPGDLPMNTSEISTGGYIGIANITIMAIDNAGYPIMDVLRIKTNYNDKNNIVLNRQPKYAPNISNVLSPSQISNAFYVKSSDKYIGSEKWKYGGTDLPKQLGILIHQQILAYYSKPNNVLSGELATKDPLFNALYEWNDKKHLLTSGALNIITGRMENVILREFTRYDHMWETWCETDDVKVDYGASTINLRVHTKKALKQADISGVPIWIIFSLTSVADGVYNIALAVEANNSIERTTIISIDTALVRITQLAPGDYGLDYGEDYS